MSAPRGPPRAPRQPAPMLELLTAPLAAAMLMQAPTLPDDDLTSSEAVPATPVVDLWRRPELRLGESQRVIAQVCREVEDWSAFLTRFDPAAFQAFEFWADEQFLWVKEEFDAPQARLFARRGSGAAAALSAATPSTRLELEVIVREMHAGRAWIEVTAARWSERQTPEGTVLHAIRALDLMERDGWSLASDQLDRALAPNLPGHVRAELLRLKGECAAEIDAQARD